MQDKTMATATHNEVSLHQREPEKKKGSAGRVVWTLVIVALIAGGVYAWRATKKPATTANAAARDNANRLGTPVVASLVKQQDMPVYLDGLGSRHRLQHSDG